MTTPRTPAPTTDPLFDAACERMAGLRAEATSRHDRPPAGPRGPLAGLRDAAAGRLIALGEALAVDDSIRGRPALRP